MPARTEILKGLVRPRTSIGFEVQKPPRYTRAQINQMTRERHEDLIDGESIQTPVGTWTRDHDIILVDFKPTAELERITIPTRKERLGRFIKRISMMD